MVTVSGPRKTREEGEGGGEEREERREVEKVGYRRVKLLEHSPVAEWVCQSENSHAAAVSSPHRCNQSGNPSCSSLAIPVWAAQVKIDWIGKRLGDARMGRMWA